MKTRYAHHIVFFIVLILTSCHHEGRNALYTSNDQYYNSEIFTHNFKGIYGEWILKAVSGEMESSGYSPEFERIVIEKIGVFKLFHNDTLLALGRINIQEDYEQHLKITFLPDKVLKSNAFYNSEKFLYLKDDNLNLYASCCNQYNYHFTRLK